MKLLLILPMAALVVLSTTHSQAGETDTTWYETQRAGSGHGFRCVSLPETLAKEGMPLAIGQNPTPGTATAALNLMIGNRPGGRVGPIRFVLHQGDGVAEITSVGAPAGSPLTLPVELVQGRGNCLEHISRTNSTDAVSGPQQGADGHWFVFDHTFSSRCVSLAQYARRSVVPVSLDPTPSEFVKNAIRLGAPFVKFNENDHAAMAVDQLGGVVGFFRGYDHCRVAVSMFRLHAPNAR